jgi:NAD(P)-dependent dehydrogenase (short-subunit alcohol dehydrogenase family)
LKTSSKPSGKVKGKTAVVTGANRGIGLAIAQALAAEGCDVLLSARNTTKLKSAAAQVKGGRAITHACDVRDPKSVAGLFAVAKREFGSLDILINNAGIAQPVVGTDELSLEQWNDVIATNLTGVFLCTRAALPLMKAGSTIVNNLSIAAVTSFPKFSAYDASKRGALGFTNSLREELRERKIRVIALIPGATNTEIWDQFMPDADRDTMMTAESVAATMLHALTLPEGTVVEEVRMLPVVGTSRH